MNGSVEIIIVNHNTRHDVIACLTSLHEAPPACASGVSVVDNASTDGSADAISATFPAVRLIRLERNVGFGAANNVALRACRQPFVLLLNSDTTAPPHAIDRLHARMLATGAAVAGPSLVDGAGHPEISFGPMPGPVTEFLQRRRVRLAARPDAGARKRTSRYVGRERIVDWVTGACLLARTDAVAAAGFFDERFFMYLEDVDLCASIRARGGRILYTNEARIVHLRGRSLEGSRAADRTAHYDRSHLAFYRKHAPAWAALLGVWLRLRGRTIR